MWRWADACRREALGGDVSGAAALKTRTPAACVRKAAARCRGDASRVTDICRRRIRVGGPAAAAACLLEVSRDRRVRVLLVRDGLRKGYDARRTGGFRVIPQPPPHLFLLPQLHPQPHP